MEQWNPFFKFFIVVHFLVNLFKNRLIYIYIRPKQYCLQLVIYIYISIYIYIYIFDNNPRFLFVWVNILDWINQLITDFWEVTQTKVWSSPRIWFTHAVSYISLHYYYMYLIALEVELYLMNEECFLTVKLS